MQAAAQQLAGSHTERQLALASLPCANAACTSLGSGSSEAGLQSRRCAGCHTARYCSVPCATAAWAAGHRAACKGLSAAAAEAPAAPGSLGAVAAPGGRVPLQAVCPVCGWAVGAAAGEDTSAISVEQHTAACAARQRETLAAEQARYGGDPAARAAAVPEVQWWVAYHAHQRQRREQLADSVEASLRQRRASREA